MCDSFGAANLISSALGSWFIFWLCTHFRTVTDAWLTCWLVTYYNKVPSHFAIIQTLLKVLFVTGTSAIMNQRWQWLEILYRCSKLQKSETLPN